MVDAFGSITRHNRLVLTMAWITEAILLIFIGVLGVVTAARFGANRAAPEDGLVAEDADRSRR